LGRRADRRRLARLEAWRRRALSNDPHEEGPVALAWADTRARYRIPVEYAAQLIDGVAQDIHITRYVTFADLAEYAYSVASTVGLMAMHIVGFSGEEAIPSAVKLGIALQLTNILRDVGEDWCSGRLYLPLDELDAFGLSETDVAEGNVDHRWRALMRFQIARNRRLYAEALPGIAMLDPDGRFAIAAAAELYRAILDDVEAHDYDVFAHRSHVGRWGKLRRLPGIWWRARRDGYREVVTG
jgi:phytoene synthase